MQYIANISAYAPNLLFLQQLEQLCVQDTTMVSDFVPVSKRLILDSAEVLHAAIPAGRECSKQRRFLVCQHVPGNIKRVSL
jgi:hypothetical protein